MLVTQMPAAGHDCLARPALAVAASVLGGVRRDAVAFLSATQDIALDAYRRELLREEELGLGNAVYVNAYRIAGLVPGSLSLILADHLPWTQVFADHRAVHAAAASR